MKIIINACHGGFGLSDAAYEKLSGLGVPIRKYLPARRDPRTQPFTPEPANYGRYIFDRALDGPENLSSQALIRLGSRYWDEWTDSKEGRTDPLLVLVVESLGGRANGTMAKLKVVEVPDGVEWEIEEYDGWESLHEVHRS